MKRPHTRFVLPEELIPAAIRMLLTYGPTAVMRGAWRDPTDDRPSAARDAREVKGFRAYDPLRWSLARHGDRSQITELHVIAADHLRRAADQARLGGLPLPWAGGERVEGYGPRSGPTASALAMLRADREFTRAMAMYQAVERDQIVMVVLSNVSVLAWTRYHKLRAQTSPQREMARLVGSLDRLVEHFDTEVREDMERGAAA